MNKKISFTKTFDVSDEYFPKPASQILPEWYKKTDSYIDGKKDVNHSLSTTGTIKKCIPVFDALISGYIIPTYQDLYVKKNENGEQIIMSHSQFIQFHSSLQAPYHPKRNKVDNLPKWMNPWAIKTEKGYSCLFIPPVHGGNKYFSILEGVVDTDNYFSPVNFPFALNDTNFEGIIPAGTPMVQVIPFKRESWVMNFGNENNKEEIKKNSLFLNSQFFNRYKTMFWSKKTYR